MTASLAASFRALFPLIAAIAAMAVVGAAVIIWVAGYGLPAALGLLVGGLIALVALLGIAAIQIDNNELLTIIAEAVTDPRDVNEMPASTLAPVVAPPAQPRTGAELARAIVGRAPIAEPRAVVREAVGQHVPAAQHRMEPGSYLRTEPSSEARSAMAPMAQPRLTVPPAPQAVRAAPAARDAAPMVLATQAGPAPTWGRAEPVLTARRS